MGFASVVDDELLLSVRGKITSRSGTAYDYELVFPGGFPRDATPIER